MGIIIACFSVVCGVREPDHFIRSFSLGRVGDGQEEMATNLWIQDRVGISETKP